MKKVGFVIPWFAKNIPGGAEADLRGLTAHLHEAGFPLEILTTRVREFTADWNEDYYPEGIEMIDGIPVRRFNVRKRDTALFDSVNIHLMHGERLSLEDQKIFCEEMVNSPDLYDYIREHADEYSSFVYIPYMFGTTYYGILACPEKAVMIPCFHDEAYVYMDVFKECFSKVKGMIFHAKAEQDLANELYDIDNVKQLLLGGGIETDWETHPEDFRNKYNIHEPFILYAGRKDEGKQVHVLLKHFDQYKRENPSDLKLVLLGGGQIAIPEGVAGDVIDLGFVDIQDKYDAYGAAELLCNPSGLESFSIVIMESWMAGRPVLVNRNCAVTNNFAHESEGGFVFDDYKTFAAGVTELISDKELAAKMGAKGKEYVQNHFTWDVIVKNVTAFLEDIAQ